ncbi:MAG: hypothetical protein DWQ07_24325 [Chloroflexi bacterium]|nr:MAG: hypothetical protein DWQ07_24325 [Chloroflexota bacterium]MBL1196261.1 hypothetical protein [Chloroflexota bacterium]NOH13556.1 hypothetical protein [Chloroflexota bacterium]
MTSPTIESTETAAPTIQSTEVEVEPPLELQREEPQLGVGQNPLVGSWYEVAQISCQTTSERRVPSPIEELIFFEDNRINVTWFPFEVYIDYVGTYAVGEGGTLEIFAEELNYLPSELDTVGTYEIDENGRLLLKDMWLGVPPLDAVHPVNCGHIFEKR